MSYSDPTKLKKVRDFGVTGIAFCVARHRSQGSSTSETTSSCTGSTLLAEKPEPKAFEAAGHESYATGVALQR